MVFLRVCVSLIRSKWLVHGLQSILSSAEKLEERERAMAQENRITDKQNHDTNTTPLLMSVFATYSRFWLLWMTLKKIWLPSPIDFTRLRALFTGFAWSIPVRHEPWAFIVRLIVNYSFIVCSFRSHSLLHSPLLPEDENHSSKRTVLTCTGRKLHAATQLFRYRKACCIFNAQARQ